MTAKPHSTPPQRPSNQISIIKANNPTVSFYRYLYNTVGADWLWWERRTWSDKKLESVILSEFTELYVLYVDGVPAGYGELNLQKSRNVELAYFGLFPEFIGQKLCGYFLRWLIDQAWRHKPTRLFVHTCTEDHPSAMYNYQKHGFKIYKKLSVQIDDPRSFGLFD